MLPLSYYYYSTTNTPWVDIFPTAKHRYLTVTMSHHSIRVSHFNDEDMIRTVLVFGLSAILNTRLVIRCMIEQVNLDLPLQFQLLCQASKQSSDTLFREGKDDAGATFLWA